MFPRFPNTFFRVLARINDIMLNLDFTVFELLARRARFACLRRRMLGAYVLSMRFMKCCLVIGFLESTVPIHPNLL